MKHNIIPPRQPIECCGVTTYIRKGTKFICPKCRTLFNKKELAKDGGD